MPSAREAVLLALIKQQKQDGYSNLILKETLRNYEFSPSDRAFFKQLFYGVLEKRLLLDYYIKQHSSVKLAKLSPQVHNILRMGVYQLVFLDRVPPSAACNEAVKLAKRYASPASGFVNGVLRGLVRAGTKIALPAPEAEPVNHLSIRYSVSPAIAQTLLAQYGFDDARRLLAAMEQPQPQYLVPNPLRAPENEFAALASEQGIKLLERGECGFGFHYAGDVESHELYRKGYFHLQGKASQLCCLALAPEPGHTVLDLCAAPGGKAFTAAGLMQNRGAVYAFDVHPHRVDLIRAGVARLGLDIVRPASADATGRLPLAERSADRVLCDVPCSALGLLGRRPELRYRSMTDTASLAALQYALLENGARYLKPGGLLVYSTCTLNREENEAQTERFLLEHPDFGYGELPEVLRARAGAAKNGGFVTLFPHTDSTDGFFIAVLRRR